MGRGFPIWPIVAPPIPEKPLERGRVDLTLTEEDVRRIVREELERIAGEQRP